MSLARIRMLEKTLVKKYGEIGRVASLYLEAGARVRILHPTRYGPIHILVYKDGDRYAVEVVKERKELSREKIETLIKKAELVKAKPILALYGDLPMLSEDLYRFCREKGVKIKRVKAQ